MDDDVDRSTGTSPLQTISTFARSVGLSPSALRLYAEQGLVVPAEVDGRTGYRYYSPAQQRRAVLVRRLRDADVSLADIRQVLDDPGENGVAILRRHAERSRSRAERTRALLGDIEAALRAQAAVGSVEGRASVDGAELAAAMEQVRGAAAGVGDAAGLDGVLIDIGDDEVAVVATDRYWMAWRRLPATRTAGRSGRFLVASDSVSEVVAWARSRRTVEVQAGESGVGLSASGTKLDLPMPDDRFPSYRQVYEGVPAPSVRLLVPRDAVVDLVGRDGDRSVLVEVERGPADAARLSADGRQPVTALVAAPDRAGRPACHVSLAGGLLARALAATVGRHLRLDLAGDLEPMALSTPDQPAFTALVMPQRP